MLLIHCPYCGEERPELEFRNAGEAHIARPENIVETSDEDFEAFLYLRTNPKGIVYERWRHMHGCGRFFNAVRDSVTDRFFTTYKAGMPKPNPDRFAKAAAAVEPLAADTSVPVVEPKKAQPAAPAKASRKPAPATAAAAEPTSAESTSGERRAARGGKRASPPSNSDAPAAEPKPSRASAATSEDLPGTTDKPKTSRVRKARPAAAGETGDATTGKAKPAPKRTRTTTAKKGEA